MYSTHVVNQVERAFPDAVDGEIVEQEAVPGVEFLAAESQGRGLWDGTVEAPNRSSFEYQVSKLENLEQNN